MQKQSLILSVILLLSACGIQGDPIAPSEQEKKQKLDLSTVQSSDQKLTDIDPMVAEGAGDVKISSLGSLKTLGKDYDASYGNSTQRLKDSVEEVKPASAYPKVRLPQPF